MESCMFFCDRLHFFDIICTVALSVTFAFLLANNIPLYEYSIFYLSI